MSPRRSLIPGAVLVGVVLLVVLPASAAGPTITQFAIPTANSHPEGIAKGPDGNVWFVESSAAKIGRMTPAGTFSEYPLSTSAFAKGISTGPDGNLWVAEAGAGKIARVTTSGQVMEFPIPTANSFPQNLVAGPDGALWFTERLGGKIGRITTSGVVTNEFTVPAPSDLFGIAAGPDGNLWFTDFTYNKVGKITTSGQVTEYAASGNPGGIAAGSDGNLWFTEYDGNKIAKITPSGTVTEYPVPTPDSHPNGITAASNGALYFTESSGDKVGQITTDGRITELALPSGSGPNYVADPGGTLFGTNYDANSLFSLFLPQKCSKGYGQLRPCADMQLVSTDTKGWAKAGNNAYQHSTRDSPPLEASTQGTFDVGERLLVQVVVRNNGDDAGTCTVHWESLQQPCGSLEPGQISVVDFQFTPAATGATTVEPEITDVSPDDPDTFNNKGRVSDPGTTATYGVYEPDVPEAQRTLPGLFSGSLLVTLPNYILGGRARRGDASPRGKVEVGVLKKGPGSACRWLADAKPRFSTRPATNGACATPIWLQTTAKRISAGRVRWRYTWKYHLDHPLPAGQYVLFARSIFKGVTSIQFNARSHSKVAFRVR
jgi:streptogramin lyase